MNLRCACVGFTLAVSLLPAFAKPALPSDVNRFAERRDNCDHFRGEEAYDADRQKFLAKQLKALCTGTDQQLKALKLKYKKNKAVLTKLQEYDVDVESK
jgi:hypothetical protein